MSYSLRLAKVQVVFPLLLFTFQGNSIDWAIYFNSLHLLEYDVLQYTKSVQLESGDFKLTHIDGGFFKFTPTSRFSGKI